MVALLNFETKWRFKKKLPSSRQAVMIMNHTPMVIVSIKLSRDMSAKANQVAIPIKEKQTAAPE